jgi:hypothetical protein
VVAYHRHETGVSNQGSTATQFSYDVTATISVMP